MKHLERRYGTGQLHFITCSCYRRMPSLGTARVRDCFLAILSEVRERYDFALLGYVVMPEHIHLLISEPRIGTPSTVMQVLKQCVSRTMRRKRRRRRASSGQMRLWDETPLNGLHLKRYAHFWQARFYDFNVWSEKKKNEKMNYMHFNPVKRGLVEHRPFRIGAKAKEPARCRRYEGRNNIKQETAGPSSLRSLGMTVEAKYKKTKAREVPRLRPGPILGLLKPEMTEARRKAGKCKRAGETHSASSVQAPALPRQRLAP
jgi:putative transposase